MGEMGEIGFKEFFVNRCFSSCKKAVLTMQNRHFCFAKRAHLSAFGNGHNEALALPLPYLMQKLLHSECLVNETV